MKYEKPEVAVLASAVEAIQGHTLKDSPVNLDLSMRPTISAAYENDE